MREKLGNRRFLLSFDKYHTQCGVYSQWISLNRQKSCVNVLLFQVEIALWCSLLFSRRFHAKNVGNVPFSIYVYKMSISWYFSCNLTTSGTKPSCLWLHLAIHDVNLLRKTVLTQIFEFNQQNCPKRVNFLKSISISIGNIPKRLNATSVRVRRLRDCISLTQNLWARSSESNSVSFRLSQFSQP